MTENPIQNNLSKRREFIDSKNGKVQEWIQRHKSHDSKVSMSVSAPHLALPCPSPLAPPQVSEILSPRGQLQADPFTASNPTRDSLPPEHRKHQRAQSHHVRSPEVRSASNTGQDQACEQGRTYFPRKIRVRFSEERG